LISDPGQTRPPTAIVATALALCVVLDAPATADETNQLPIDVAQIDTLAADIATIHGVTLGKPVQTMVLEPDKLRERLRELITKDYDPEALVDEGRLMVRLGLLSAGTCYEEVVYGVLEQQVVGLYDPYREQLLLVGGSTEAMMREVLVHELTHAVQDQGFDLGARLEPVPGQMDARTGLQAVSEGDALLMEQIVGGMLAPASITADQLRAMMELMSEPGDPFLKAPSFIREALLFPYVYGFVLVRRAYQAGGYAAVNDLLTHPPASSEQVIHPERIGIDDPVTVQLSCPGDLADLYRDAASDVMGEFSLRTWLEQFIDEAEASRAVEGWGGDRYVFAWPSSSDVPIEHLDHGVLILMTVWDPSSTGDNDLEARQFAEALEHYIERRYAGGTLEGRTSGFVARIGADQLAVIERRDRKVLFVEGLPEMAPGALDAMIEQMWASTGP
jgi:hypothetical protein